VSLNETPSSVRLHIGLFGRRNSGKSSLINALTGQHIAIVSDVAGSTTDPVYKAMEFHGIGPVVFIDTAGIDDSGGLGRLRVAKTREAAEKTDVAIMVFNGEPRGEKPWIDVLKSRGVPVIAVLNGIDAMTMGERGQALDAIRGACGLDALPVSALTGEGLAELREKIVREAPGDDEAPSLTGTLCAAGDTVLLVMPQDIQAPKGRLILPQVQVIRELLDKGCLPLCSTTDRAAQALSALKEPPALVIVDSQCFPAVAPLVPQGTRLTSFSVLFAGFKGDLAALVRGARVMPRLTEDSRVLIAEACTHVPLEEDIGRVKIPRLLRARFGKNLTVDFARGVDFPENLKVYDLIIHCGACTFNRRFMLSRIARAAAAGVPITNYGLALAQLNGILDKVSLPQEPQR
jgi:[FeFe] hydrogenase H-cluster maturation GTPase HydF